ncbi:uncharacterized protein LOC141849766 isoform X2 [Brevipalpus obovatus]|uniref:uncharacterized protein LOC141849766 isoform X2 n=1 Tax=Brevipalpus obovatus TaxID=246614 RepID=UPI003D9ED0D2
MATKGSPSVISPSDTAIHTIHTVLRTARHAAVDGFITNPVIEIPLAEQLVISCGQKPYHSINSELFHSRYLCVPNANLGPPMLISNNKLLIH